MEYKIGQILTAQTDLEIERCFGEKVVIPKGSKAIIGVDRFAHHFRDGSIQRLEKDAELKGYDSEGLAEYLYLCLNHYLPLEEMCEDYDINMRVFKEEIKYALEDLGFY